MRKLLALLTTGAAFMLCGATITPDFNGEFKEQGKYWGFLGVKRGTLSSAADGALVITRAKEQPYADVGNTKNTFELRKGDKVTMTLRAKGKGTLAAGFRLMKTGNMLTYFPLKSEYSDFVCTFDLSKAKLPERAVVKFILNKKCETAVIKYCKIVIERAEPGIPPLKPFKAPQLPKTGRFPEKGFYLGTNLMVDSSFPKIDKVAERAARAGYNTVYLGDWKMAQPWAFGLDYVDRVRRVAEMFRKRNIRVVVGICCLGDPSPYMNEFPEEVECAPSKKTPFIVKNGVFTAENEVVNGSFEEGLKNWRLDHGANIRIDDKVSASGKKSLYFAVKKPGDAPLKMIRAWHKIKVRPFQQYTMTVKIKTKNVKGKGSSLGISAGPLGLDPKLEHGFRYITHRRIDFRNPIKSTQDWKEYKITFNSFECTDMTLVCGAWNMESGEFWVDDVKLAPSSFLNVVRRRDTAVKVTSADGKKVYVEGKDFAPVIDPISGKFRWVGDYDDSHAAPVIKVLPGSAIKEGEKILVDYYHASFALTNVCICLNSPVLKKVVEKQIDWFMKAIRPEGFIIAIDEHRCYGYDPACEKSGMNGGQALNHMAKFTYDKIKAASPDAAIYMWNDMFDPYANCYPDNYYYSIRGKASLTGNWLTLPKDIIILRWTTKTAARVTGSMKHWRDLGMKYIQFPGYFTEAVFNPKSEGYMKETVKDPACIGVGFAQWSGIDNFRPHLENFLKMVDKVKAEEQKSKK